MKTSKVLPTTLTLAILCLGLAWPATTRAGFKITLKQPPDGDYIRGGLPPIGGCIYSWPDPWVWPLTGTWVAIQRDSDGAFWSGSQWQGSSAWITVLVPVGLIYSGPWTLPVRLPSYADLSEGSYTISAHAETLDDKRDAQTHFKVDRTPPVVSITSPTDGAGLSSLTLISGSATDTGSGVVSCDVVLQRQSDQLCWDGQNWSSGNPINTSGPSQFTGDYWSNWSISDNLPGDSDLLEGNYLITATALDRMGNIGTATVTFIVDRTPPLVPVVSSPADGATIPALFNIWGTTADNPGGAGIDHVNVLIQRARDNSTWNGSDWVANQTELPATLGVVLVRVPVNGHWGSMLQTSWSPSAGLPTGDKLENGDYELIVTAYDVMNLHTAATNTFTVNKVAPTITIAAPSNGGTFSNAAFPVLSGTATVTSGLGIAKVVLYLAYTYINDYNGQEDEDDWNGVEWVNRQTTALTATVSGTNWTYSAGLPSGGNLSEGHYLVLAYVYDTGGNDNFAACHVYIDRTAPPPPVIQVPTSGAVLNALSGIQGTATDDPNGYGLDHVELALVGQFLDPASQTTKSYYWDGSVWQPNAVYLRALCSDTNWFCTNALPAGTNLYDASYVIQAHAINLATNVGPDATCNFTIDTVPPVVTITSPTNGEALLDLSGCAGTVTDSSPIRSVTLNLWRDSDLRSWNGAAWANGYAVITATVSGATWTCNTSLPHGDDLPPGSYYLNAEGDDTVGNSGSATVLITVLAPNPLPALSWLDPSAGFAGDPGFTLAVVGSNFVQGATVLWNGADRTTYYVDDQELLAQINAADVASAGTVAVSVFNPAPGGGTSTSLGFAVQTRPVVPNDNFSDRIVLGGYSASATGSNAGATLENGEPNPVSGMTGGRSVWWSWTAPGSGTVTTDTKGSSFDTLLGVYTGNSLASLTLVASDNNSGGNFTSQVVFQGEAGTQYQIQVDGVAGAYGTIQLNINESLSEENPHLTSLVPPSAVAGGPSFTLQAIGWNFDMNCILRWNGSNQMTTLVSGTELTATIPADYIAVPATCHVDVLIPGSGGLPPPGMSNPPVTGTFSEVVNFVIQPGNPTPAISSLSPGFAFAGGPPFTLTVNGSNFMSSAVVAWNGVNQSTTFINSNQLMAIISPTLIASAGTAAVTVTQPGAQPSASVTFTINPPNPVPALTSLSPLSTCAGGPALTLTLGGSNFMGASVVRWNGADLATTFGSSTQLTATVTASAIAATGAVQIAVFNPPPGGGLSGPLDFAVLPPKPVPLLVSLNPSSALAGADSLMLTANGSNFVQSAIIQWNGTGLATTFVDNTQLIALVPKTLLALAGSVNIIVSQDGVPSQPLAFVIGSPNPVPVISQLIPNSATAGDPAFILSVTGTNFLTNSVVRWNGADRETLSGSITQLMAKITAADVASTGTVAVSVFNPAPGGGLADALDFVIQPPKPVPTLSTLSPNSAVVGGNLFVLTVSGSNFTASASILWNGTALATTFVGSGQLMAIIPKTLLTTAGTATVTVVQDGVASNPLSFAVVAPNPVPSVAALSPNSAYAGGTGTTVTVSGTNFIPASVVRWNGADRPTTFNSSTQLVAQFSAADLASAGTASVSVFNPSPGGGGSTALVFTVQQGNATPALFSLQPSSATAGAGVFLLTVNGTNFVNGATIRWNNADQSTSFINSNQLCTLILPALVAAPGTATVTVSNPPPGGGISGPLPFAIAGQQVLLTLAPLRLQGGGFYYRVTGPPGSRVIIETSTNLLNWTVASTNDLTGGQTDLSDPSVATSKRRFFRGVLSQ